MKHFTLLLVFSGCAGWAEIGEYDRKRALERRKPDNSAAMAEDDRRYRGVLAQQERRAEANRQEHREAVAEAAQRRADLEASAKAAEERRHAPEGLAERICEDREQNDELKEAIAYERAIGRASGFVNASRLHSLARDLLDSQADERAAVAEYRQVAHHAPRACPKN